MAHLIEELRSQARALPPADRVRLAEELLATVHEPDGDVEAAWDEEIRNRIAEIDAGTANLVSTSPGSGDYRTASYQTGAYRVAVEIWSKDGKQGGSFGAVRARAIKRIR